ncbi:MAG TPA: 6-carboxytetrahydropterin synthase [Gammaproteobacteria bacterium]|jgi:6-pyruvoyltetrahydropterin/6-carboxytetrahydropterin synthase|nr:6-carboxytetrahydropterin synthase [Gammaproteobacteria bacterium]
MSRLSTIELFKEDMKFSAGHFTIFSSDDRENLHGHNYNVYIAITTIIEDEGFSFDYRYYKEKLRVLCDSLNQTVIIPGKCKHLRIEEKEDYFYIYFHTEKIIFAKRDITILPITNTTVEELSNWILMQLLQDQNELIVNKIQKIKIKVFSGPGQSASATWRKSDAQ